MSDAVSIARKIMRGAAEFRARKVGLQNQSLDAILAAIRQQGNGVGEYLRHLLDVQIVDDAEVERQTGYGGLLRPSISHRCEPVAVSRGAIGCQK